MLILLLTLVLSLGAFGLPKQSNFLLHTSAQSQSGSGLQPAEEDNIREAVFRYQFKHNASGQQQNAKAYFLSLGKDKDPGDQFMERFKNHKPPVKKASQGITNNGVRDKETGERGLIFGVTSIKQINEDEVEVNGGYYEAGLSASGNVYRVKREGDRWVVKEDRTLWIS